MTTLVPLFYFILFIHCFERVAQLASKLFYLVALYISNIITYIQIKQHHHHIE